MSCEIYLLHLSFNYLLSDYVASNWQTFQLSAETEQRRTKLTIFKMTDSYFYRFCFFTDVGMESDNLMASSTEPRYQAVGANGILIETNSHSDDEMIDITAGTTHEYQEYSDLTDKSHGES